MIIHAPEVIIDNGTARLTAEIEWDSNGIVSLERSAYVPDKLWYSFDETYLDSVTQNLDPFLTPLVSVAMYYKENIVLKGSISEQLAYALHEYQRTLHFWKPEWFTVISISYDSLVSDAVSEQAVGALCSYSGGVDSNYTLYTHLPAQQPNESCRVTHAFYSRGFETNAEDVKTQDAKIKSFRSLTETLGVDLLVTESNARDFQEFEAGSLIYYMTWGSVLAGTAQLFENLVGRYYFSCDNTHDYPMISTINHTLMPLLSTNKLTIIPHGASVSKYEKVKTLATWPETYNRLVVCFDYPNGLTNCSRCVKCTLTMNLLDMHGVLEKYKTFSGAVDRSVVRKTRHRKLFLETPAQWIRFAKMADRKDLVFDYRWVLWMSRLEIMLRSLYQLTQPVRHPVTTVYAMSAALKSKSSVYAQVLHTIK